MRYLSTVFTILHAKKIKRQTVRLRERRESTWSTFIRWLTVKISPLISADVYMIDTVSFMYTRQQRQKRISVQENHES